MFGEIAEPAPALGGLRPEGAPLEPLPIPAVPPQHMEDLLVGQWKPRR